MNSFPAAYNAFDGKMQKILHNEEGAIIVISKNGGKTGDFSAFSTFSTVLSTSVMLTSRIIPAKCVNIR